MPLDKALNFLENFREKKKKYLAFLPSDPGDSPKSRNLHERAFSRAFERRCTFETLGTTSKHEPLAGKEKEKKGRGEKEDKKRKRNERAAQLQPRH